MGKIPTENFTVRNGIFIVGQNAKSIWDKLESISTKRLNEFSSHIFQGLKTSADKIYIVEEIERKSGNIKIFSKEKEENYWIEPNLVHPLIKGCR